MELKISLFLAIISTSFLVDLVASEVMPYPGDCTKYKMCDYSGCFVFDCPPGTEFNPKVNVCDYPILDRESCGKRATPLPTDSEVPFDENDVPRSGCNKGTGPCNSYGGGDPKVNDNDGAGSYNHDVVAQGLYNKGKPEPCNSPSDGDNPEEDGQVDERKGAGSNINIHKVGSNVPYPDSQGASQGTPSYRTGSQGVNNLNNGRKGDASNIQQYITGGQRTGNPYPDTQGGIRGSGGQQIYTGSPDAGSGGRNVGSQGSNPKGRGTSAVGSDAFGPGSGSNINIHKITSNVPYPSSQGGGGCNKGKPGPCNSHPGASQGTPSYRPGSQGVNNLYDGRKAEASSIQEIITGGHITGNPYPDTQGGIRGTPGKQIYTGSPDAGSGGQNVGSQEPNLKGRGISSVTSNAVGPGTGSGSPSYPGSQAPNGGGCNCSCNRPGKKGPPRCGNLQQSSADQY